MTFLCFSLDNLSLVIEVLAAIFCEGKERGYPLYLPYMVMNTCISSTVEAKAGESRVQGQLGIPLRTYFKTAPRFYPGGCGQL